MQEPPRLQGHLPRPGHFQHLLNDSERALQDTFPSAFGELYMQSARAFRDLYTELRLYYRGADLQLEDTLAEFWARLLERLFRQPHPQRLLPDDYLDCLGKQAEALRPFGDAPRELRLRATRAFVAARTFVQGLGAAGDVVRKVAQVCTVAQGSQKPPGIPAQPPPLQTPGSCAWALPRTCRQHLRAWVPLWAAHPLSCPGTGHAGSGQEKRRAWGWTLSQLQGSGGQEMRDVSSEAGVGWGPRPHRPAGCLAPLGSLCQTHLVTGVRGISLRPTALAVRRLPL